MQLFAHAPLYERQADPELAIVKLTWLSLVIFVFAQGPIPSILCIPRLVSVIVA